MVMCCSKKVFISLCNIYRKSAYTLAVKSRERKEKLVLFRASRIEVEPKDAEKNLSKQISIKEQNPAEPAAKKAGDLKRMRT
jgi:hypothetical protein